MEAARPTGNSGTSTRVATHPLRTVDVMNSNRKKSNLRAFQSTFVRFGRPMLFLVPLLFVFTFMPRFAEMDEGDAAQAYLQAGDAIRDGRSMYEPLPPTGPHRIGNYYLYPPPLGALVSLLPRMSAGSFSALVLLANIAGVWAFAWALARLARIPLLTGTLLAALVLLLMPGLSETIAIGNVDPVVFGLVGLGLAVPPLAAATLIGAAAALKVTPIWALGVLVVREGKGAWLGAGLVILACLIVTILAVGPAGFVAESLLWARRIAPTLSQGQFETLPITVNDEVRSGWLVNGNISLAFAPLRLLIGPPPLGESIPTWARLYLSVVQFGVPALVAFLTRRRPPRVQAAWVIAAATLAAPIMRGGYVPILLLVPALLLGQRREVSTP
jgi:hypothetical protein